VEVQLHLFLIFDVSGQLHNFAAFPLLKESAGNIEYRGGWCDEPGWMLRRTENNL
jgi:hypothetical protein